jgi:hypothetical protein
MEIEIHTGGEIFLTDTLFPKEPSQSGDISPARKKLYRLHPIVKRFCAISFRKFSLPVAGSKCLRLTAQDIMYEHLAIDIMWLRSCLIPVVASLAC